MDMENVCTMTAKLLYESDFYHWTVDQVERLRLGKIDSLDLEHLADEIESLGNQQRSELENRLAVLLGHLLKWDLQPDLRGKSWQSTIREQRRQIQKLIKKNPSLKSYLDEAISEGYESALDLVVRETPLDYKDLPQACPYAIAQIFDNNFPIGVEVG
jgi:hypothetical protein